ncbi:MAG TPA: 16S rRNA (cytidine(1402)-2'-O)-methyltransferase [Candidatus Binatia bacterium]|jgi:16S rRNA (cytidine1402-2'-O)-methyltransferase
MAGVLYIVATPIGNLEDISLRALRILKEVDLIAAEDTRHTHHLLSHYGIETALTSYHEHNERRKAQVLVERLRRGANIALVTDAGTPVISDPGYRLVTAAIDAAIKVTPIPGASAVTAVVAASGLPPDRFAFEGFLPGSKKERRARLLALKDDTRTLVFYEAPHRIKESLSDLGEILGDRDVVVAREVTKLHEEFRRGSASELAAQLGNEEVRGEITLAVRGSSGTAAVSQATLEAEIRRLRGAGMHVKAIAGSLAEQYGCSKKSVYRLALELDKKA